MLFQSGQSYRKVFPQFSKGRPGGLLSVAVQFECNDLSTWVILLDSLKSLLLCFRENSSVALFGLFNEKQEGLNFARWNGTKLYFIYRMEVSRKVVGKSIDSDSLRGITVANQAWILSRLRFNHEANLPGIPQRFAHRMPRNECEANDFHVGRWVEGVLVWRIQNFSRAWSQFCKKLRKNVSFSALTLSVEYILNSSFFYI